MLMLKKFGVKGYVAALASLAVVATAPRVQADTTIEQGSAILVWPKVVAQTLPSEGPLVDTLIEISNLDDSAPTAAHCFYVNANSHCANTGSVCTSALDCAGPNGSFGSCLPGWIEVDFDVILTADQPLAWSAVDGLGQGDIPCPGTFGNCSGNQGTRVPPVTETPFIGELKCIQVSPTVRVPAECTADNCENDLAGRATIFEVTNDLTDGKSYNAVGIQTAGDNDGNRILVLGGEDPATREYEPCHQTLIFDHLFDGAADPISEGAYVTKSELTLVPCTEDFLTQDTDAVTAQFIVYNEFEQRFSTSRQVRCLFDSQISLIDTSQPARSIFNANVAGTIAGNTRIFGVGSGLLGVAVMNLEVAGPVSVPSPRGGAAYSLDGFGFRADADRIRVP